MGVADARLVAPFQGERYAPDVPLGAVIAPPYDVIDDTERRMLARHDPRNVVHVILPEANSDRYAHAARVLDTWRRAGTLVRDSVAGVYVLRQRFTTPGGGAHERTGVIAAVAAEPFSGGRVRPHERTHAGPKQDRLALLRETRTMCESLLMLSRDSTGRLRDELVRATRPEPAAHAELAGVEISVWCVGNAAAHALAVAAGAEALYIADGHHRYETAVAYRSQNADASRTLALIVPLGDPGLVVLPTHRLIVGRAIMEEALALLATQVSLERLPAEPDVKRALADVRRDGGGCVVLLRGGHGFRVVRKEGVPGSLAALQAPVRSLAVTWADALVVPALQVAAGDGTISYTPDLDAAVAATREGPASAAVLLEPPAVVNVLDVADARAVMPPKATFFTPKVPSGVVFLNYATASW
jgi:uncharacterized protein (DUF1015 family)